MKTKNLKEYMVPVIVTVVSAVPAYFLMMLCYLLSFLLPLLMLMLYKLHCLVQRLGRWIRTQKVIQWIRWNEMFEKKGYQLFVRANKFPGKPESSAE